jgi:GNAT superfamily N-acetyltransferase
MVTYQAEKLSDILEQLKSLLPVHWEEIARNKNKVPLDPDYQQYLAIERVGCLHIVTARDDGTLIGYIINFVSPHLHYKAHKFANNDILYLAPKYRGRGVGIKLIKFNETSLFAMGVSVVHIHMKLAHDFGCLLERLGYTEIERMYEKVNF